MCVIQYGIYVTLHHTSMLIRTETTLLVWRISTKLKIVNAWQILISIIERAIKTKLLRSDKRTSYWTQIPKVLLLTKFINIINQSLC